MSEQNNQSVMLNEQEKQQKNKKMLLWAILVVVAGIVVYVLFLDNKSKFRLNTEVRHMLPTGSDTLSPTSVATETSVPLPSLASSPLSIDLESSNQVKTELANLFRSYA